MTLAHRIAARFVQATSPESLEDQRDEIRSMKEKLEEFIFMEETAIKLAAEIQKLSQRHPADRNLAEAA